MGLEPKGLCAWSASIVDGVHVRELGGISATAHFSRLTIVAAIEALGQVRRGANVELAHSDKYLKDFVFDRLDEGLEPALKKKDVKNLDLFPALRRVVSPLGEIRNSVIRVEHSDHIHARTADLVSQKLTEDVPVQPPFQQTPETLVRDIQGSATDAGVPWA